MEPKQTQTKKDHKKDRPGQRRTMGGAEMTDKLQRFKTGKYAGNKWGRKYLSPQHILHDPKKKARRRLMSRMTKPD
jgi:hypothetical protein